MVKVRKCKIPYHSTSFYNIIKSSFHQDFHRRTSIKEVVSEKYDGIFSQDIVVYNSIILNQTPYVTCEKYLNLNKTNSETFLIQSTSTVFYDLDYIANRHSCQCINDSKLFKKHVDDEAGKDVLKGIGFKAKSEAIVQECATQIQPKLKSQYRIEKHRNKRNCISDNKKEYIDDKISSEIFLQDEPPETKLYGDEICDHNQKVWSYAKYNTESMKPKNSKKEKNKDRGKRTDDPCPCQLFSYACPCTNQKSLTSLANSSKSLTVNADKVTSTLELPSDDKPKNQLIKQKQSSLALNNKNKVTNADKTEVAIDSKNICSDKGAFKTSSRLDESKLKNNIIKKTVNKKRSNISRKENQIICPHCKEIVTIEKLTENTNYAKSNIALHRYETEEYSIGKHVNSIDNKDSCSHSPPCELVPMCQLLPADIEYTNNSTIQKLKYSNKSNPKHIRITKACRHHPPCTVVPFCQKINVLKNNCEYIPPCLHRPRCINTPLCVPITKTHEYTLFDEPCEVNSLNCSHIPRCQYCCTNKRDSVGNITHNFYSNQNTYEYLSQHSPRLPINPNMVCMSTSNSPCIVASPCNVGSPCNCGKSTKSCQYDSAECKCNIEERSKDDVSVNEIVYIRDVACQFRNKSSVTNYFSINRNASCNLKSLNEGKVENFSSNLQRDKCGEKPPVDCEDISMTTVSTSSFDIDELCPSHGKQAQNKKRLCGYNTKQFQNKHEMATDINPTIQYCLNYHDNEESQSDSINVDDRDFDDEQLPATLPPNLVGKKNLKKGFVIRRQSRRRIKANNRIHKTNYKKISFQEIFNNKRVVQN